MEMLTHKISLIPKSQHLMFAITVALFSLVANGSELSLESNVIEHSEKISA
jgi:hypothetical protein